MCVCGTGPFTTLWFAGNRIWTRRIANFRSIRYVPSRISSNRYRVPSAFHVTWYSRRLSSAMLSRAKLTGCDPGNRDPPLLLFTAPHRYATTARISAAWPSNTASPITSSWRIGDPSALPDAVVAPAPAPAISSDDLGSPGRGAALSTRVARYASFVMGENRSSSGTSASATGGASEASEASSVFSRGFDFF